MTKILGEKNSVYQPGQDEPAERSGLSLGMDIHHLVHLGPPFHTPHFKLTVASPFREATTVFTSAGQGTEMVNTTG
jgi:hypothetical protein